MFLAKHVGCLKYNNWYFKLEKVDLYALRCVWDFFGKHFLDNKNAINGTFWGDLDRKA